MTDDYADLRAVASHEVLERVLRYEAERQERMRLYVLAWERKWRSERPSNVYTLPPRYARA